MSTTSTFSFMPSDTAVPPYSFAFSTEGQNYTGQCVWNMARQDWYLQIFDAGQNMLINHPLVSSPLASPQNLAPGIFARSSIYYTQNIAQITLVENALQAAVAANAVPYLGQDIAVTISINDIVISIGAGQTTVTFNPLATQGASIIDAATGNTVILKTINWSGAQGTNYVPDGLWTVSYKDLIDQIAAWGFNCVRFPFSGSTFAQTGPASGAINVNAVGSGTGANDNLDFTTNQSLTAPVYKSIYGIFDTLIGYCAQKGLRVIFDHHLRQAGSGSNDGAPTDGTYTQADWQATWVALATHYSVANGFPNVCGADLHNEPYLLTWSQWITACNGVIAAIQAVNTDWLMIVEGVGTYNNVAAWEGAQLQGAAVLQPTLPIANKLVYSPHDYGQSVGTQPWLQTTTQTVAAYPTNLNTIWDNFWGYIAKTGIAPVLVGEFGGLLGVNGSGATDPTQVNAAFEQQWITQLVSYIQTNGLSFGYWALNPNSADTGGLLEDDWKTPQATKIAYLQSIL